MRRAYYSSSIRKFCAARHETILGELAQFSEFSIEPPQRDAWLQQIELLQPVLADYEGAVYFEYSIPRMGKRIDVLLVIRHVIFLLEFKVGESEFHAHAIDQVFDYALDLKNFHETSHDKPIVPVLIATEARERALTFAKTPQTEDLLFPVCCSPSALHTVINQALGSFDGSPIDIPQWEQGRYSPTPTIIEAALALYRGHGVAEISRSDAGAKNLHETSDAISTIIEEARRDGQKAICFVTGVPGAGKTLIGLNIATKHLEAESDLYSVFLSGNAPLVAVLQEALARDRVQRQRGKGNTLTKKAALSEVKSFIQIVHHYRDEYIRDRDNAPVDHVALFDEAQRAWNLKKTADFMQKKKKLANFSESEPEFLISCVDRHKDWGVVICLVGGGQEINTGEAGIGEWLSALERRFPHWQIHISDRLTDSEYNAEEALANITDRTRIHYRSDLHLSTSMRSFRAENVSLLVKQILDRDVAQARATLNSLSPNYPIVLTRSVQAAKQWLREKARGSERYGMIVSSSAERLRPHAIHVKAPMNPVHWFLADKEDVRSSYYLEDVATEFTVQGLELDWACVTWDGDFRSTRNGWSHYSFVGQRWNRIHKAERQVYLKNAYRVLLTRARQGMVIVVPEGDPHDPTREPAFYDGTFDYLRGVGLQVL